MQFYNSPQRYGAIAKLLHWLTVVLVVLAWGLGTFGDDLPRGAQSAGLFVHMSTGLTILTLLVIRVIWRTTDPPPPPELTPLGNRVVLVGKITHFALYLLLAATPIAGIVLQFARGNAVPLFGVLEIASPWVRDRAFAGSVREIHQTLANAVMILGGLHSAAALVHHWVFRDRTLERMLPGVSR
ncbi:MAG TPA: cytochrome b [Stellaceae bacterium]|nr:cytochrome b [Stellaceae bacterium]